MIKKIVFILLLTNISLPNKINNNIIKIDKKKYIEMLKQARLLDRNGLFNESKLIYESILSEDPGNKVAFNKIKIILKNEKNYDLLKKIAEKYQLHHSDNPMVKIDLLETYLISNDARWKILSDEIFNKNIEADFIIRALLNKLMEVDYTNYADSLIALKRFKKNKQDFYSLDMGNYYISRLKYEKAISHFLIFLNKNPNQYNKISNKIIAIPNYVDLQKKIKKILNESSFSCSKILLSDLAFKSGDSRESFNLLKTNFQEPNQFLDFAYQNKKIKNYDLAIEICQYIIDEDYNSRMTILAILEMADVFEKKSIKSKFDFPISQYFYSNEILSPPYNYVESKSLGILNGAISLYDSLYSVSRGSDAGFKLAEIKFTILNDLDKALVIYNDCIKYSKNNSIRFKSILRTIDVMIAKGNLREAKKILIDNISKYKDSNRNNILTVKNMQIDFFNMEESVTDSISNIILRMPKDNILYNDLLEIQSLIFSFKNNPELLEKFSKIQFLIFQGKEIQAINELIDMHKYSTDNIMINDFVIYQLSYLFLLNNKSEDALNYLEGISHKTIFSEFSYILKAEIFDFMLDDKNNAVNLYLDFLDRYPLSIFYDDIRFRLRDIAN